MTKILQSIPYPTYTTAERDLLVGVLKNTYINNSDTGKVEEFDGSIWIGYSSSSFTGGTSNQILNDSIIVTGTTVTNVIDNLQTQIQNITGGTTTIPIENVTVWSPLSGYTSGNTYVTYVNTGSSDPQFQTEAIYRCDINTIAGESPETNPEKWIYNGQSVEITYDNTSKIYITGADPLGQIRSITGYKHGDNVIFGDHNTVMFFNQNAVVGASYNPATNTYVEVFKPYDWTDTLKGGWVEQASTDRQRKFYTDAADIRHNARNYPVSGDIVDLSTGNVLRLTQTGAPFTDNGTTTIIPTYELFGVACAFVKVGELGSSGQSIISDTYANIKLLVDSSSLVPESTYILTDYQTKHLIPNSDPQEINIGNIEPLTLIAATTNTFYIEAKSSLFPTDIIHYRFDDDSCEDGTRDIENKK